MINRPNNTIEKLSELVASKDWSTICDEFDLHVQNGSLDFQVSEYSAIFHGLINSGRTSDALELVTSALQRYPSNSNLWRHKGVALQRMKHSFSEIESCYLQAISLSPDTGAYYTLLAKLQFRNMDYVSAIENFTKAINLGHASGSSYAALGRSLVKTGAREKALVAFEKSLKIKESTRTLAFYNEIKRQLQSNDELVSADYYDEIFSNTQKYNTKGQDSIYVPVWNAIVQILRNEGHHSVIDLGCGPGQFAEYLCGKMDIKYLGVDFSAEAIKIGQAKCSRYNFLNASIFDFDYRNTDEDTLLCLEVLEHIPDDITLLEGLPSGRKLIASVPNYDAFGHLRVFPDASSVTSRYGRFFKDLSIQCIEISPRAKIWLFTGILE